MPTHAALPVQPPHQALDRELREAVADALQTLGRLDVDDDEALARTLDRIDGLFHRLGEAPPMPHVDTLGLLRLQADMLRQAKPSRRRPIALQLYRHLAVFTAFRLRQAPIAPGNASRAMRVVEAEPALARHLSTPLQPWLALA